MLEVRKLRQSHLDPTMAGSRNKSRRSKFSKISFFSTFTFSVTSKKSPNVYKSCPKIISQQKINILTHLPKNDQKCGQFIAIGFEKLTKVQ